MTSTDKIARLESEIRVLRLEDDLVAAKNDNDHATKQTVAVALREARREHRVAFAPEPEPGDAAATPRKITSKGGNG